MEKKYQVSMFVIGILAASGIGISAWAYRGNPDKFSPNYSSERHEQMEKAFENNDYAAWKELMGGRGRITEIVNEENFAKFSEMHKFLEDGKYAEANQIRQDLKLGLGNGPGRRGMHRDNRERGSNVNFRDTNGDGVCDHRP